MLGRRYRSYSREKRRDGVAPRIIRALLLIFVTYFIVDSVFLRSYKIGSEAMMPALSIGDRVLVSQIAYGVPFGTARMIQTGEIRRGDVVLVRPGYFGRSTWQVISDPFISFFTLQRREAATTSKGRFTTSLSVKRVIGIPGDTVKMEGNTFYVKPMNAGVFTDEVALSDRPYALPLVEYPTQWSNSLPFSGTQRELILGDDQYFVASDDRLSTHD